MVVATSTSYEPVQSVPDCFPDDVPLQPQASAGSNFRCLVPQCQDRSFKNLKDYKRHAKIHDPNAILWYCGCCENLGQTYRGKERKDKVQTHLRNRHERPKSEDNKGIQCPVEGCYTLFIAHSCLNFHLDIEHPNFGWERTSQQMGRR